MRPIFHPTSITVVGGGNDCAKPGGRIVRCLKNSGFPHLTVVNPGGEVQGLPTYGSVDALPASPDLAFLAVPVDHVIPSVRALADRGTRGFVVLSCGFSELDARGAELERELVQIVESAGGALVGPNSLGVFTPSYVGTFGGPDHEPVPGTIDFISASGSTAAFIMEAGLDRGLRFASLVSVGNSAQIGVEDVLAYQDHAFATCPAKAKLLYLEAIEEPQRLLVHARSLRNKGCYVIALKAGTTEVGARAASSHTGAIASRDAAVSALFDKAGIIRAYTKTQMVDIAGLLSCYGVPRGRRIAIVTHAGGPGVLLADELSKQGFSVPTLGAETQRRLARALMPGSATANPIDFLASGKEEHLRAIFTILDEQERNRIDGICVVFGSPGLFDIGAVLDEIAAAARGLSIPVYPVLPSVRTAAAEAKSFRDRGFFYFTDEVHLAQALNAIVSVPAPTDPVPSQPPIDLATVEAVLERARAAGTSTLEADAVGAVLGALGFCAPPFVVVTDPARAGSEADAMGYPVVVKVAGISHKSDVGGVIMGLRSPGAVVEAARAVLRIDGARGAVIQKQVEGLELIVGVTHEPPFGHLVLFGIGGIYAEIVRDVSMALAPLSELEACRMLDGIRATSLLAGARGRAPVDRRTLAQRLQALSALVDAFPSIREMDVNPLMAAADGLWAVDARIEIDLHRA